MGPCRWRAGRCTHRCRERDLDLQTRLSAEGCSHRNGSGCCRGHAAQRVRGLHVQFVRQRVQRVVDPWADAGDRAGRSDRSARNSHNRRLRTSRCREMKPPSTQPAMRTARRVVAAFARHASSATADRGGVDHRGEREPATRTIIERHEVMHLGMAVLRPAARRPCHACVGLLGDAATGIGLQVPRAR